MNWPSFPEGCAAAKQRILRSAIVWALLQCGAGFGVMAQHLSDISLSPWFFLSGGIGAESQAEMLAQRDYYSVRLTFAEAGTGAFVTGVSVTIQPVGGQDLFGRLADVGPFFYVRLQPGSYRISASYQGMSKTWLVQIRHQPVDQVIYWPAR
jgi:hypothetical protein